ncbi:MAG: dihydroorotate dehydrogenase-like protein [Breznakibacter sp.]
MQNLHTTFMGLPIENPLVVGSSGLSGSLASIKKLAEAGAGAIVLKSVFEEEILREAGIIQAAEVTDMKGNAEFFDYFEYELKQDVLDRYTTLIRKAKSEVSIPIIASINCLSSGEWASYAQKLQQAGADGIELNIMMLGSNPSLTAQKVEELHFDIIKNVLKHTTLPVSVKVSPYFSAGASFYQRLSKSGIQGLVFFNRMAEFDFDIKTRQFTNGEVYSKPLDYSNTLRWISILSAESACPLTASTGVHDAETLIKMLMAGAHTVQVTSALYTKGIAHLSKLIAELKEWMAGEGFESLEDFRGCMARKAGDRSELFERVQFMKYFSDHDLTT